MHIRRILLAFSLAASTASVAFADLVEVTLNQVGQEDRLEQLTRTLSQGNYAEQTDIIVDQPSQAPRLDVSLRDQPIELNNATIAQKYGSSATKNTSYSTNLYSWLKAHPLPVARVSSSYGTRTMNGRAERHSGLDLAAPTGTPIYATGPGIVTKSGWGTGYGQYVEINHGNGYLTRYAHASRLISKVGDRVEAGEHIANVGCTGRCTGPHLHYEVVKDGQRKNPSTYLAMLP
jgi:murein DD-endopeptidase MepM/ murein hydrolase activator NlpD